MKKIPWLFFTLRTARRQSSMLLVLEALRALALLAGAYLTARWLDAVFLRGAQPGDTAPVLLVLFFVMGAAAGARREETRLLARLSAASRLRVRAALHARLLAPDAAAEAPVLPLALEAVDALDLWFSRVMPLLLSLICVVPLTLAAACACDPLTAGLLLLTLPVAPFLLYLIGRVTREASRMQWQRMEALTGAFAELLRALPTLKLFGRAAAQRAEVTRLSDALSQAALRVLQLAFVSAFALELITTLSIAIVAVSIGLRLLYGQIAFETAFFLLLITPEFFQPLRQAGTAFHSAMTAQTAEASLRRLLAPTRADEAGGDILQSAREARLAMGSAAGTRQADIPASQETDAAPTVLIRTLTYTYPHHPLPALAGRSLVLPAGTMTAVTGPSGCGKSTLLLTLAGLCAPYEGSITIAGRELSSLPCAARTRLISYVPQEPHIFSGTLAENIALFAAPDAHRLADARRAAALDAAAGVPWENSQQFGAGGAGLSEGQKKRLGLARAFYQNRPLVLLDEPTATLDRAAAARVRAALRQYLAGKTVLIATHDAALLALADHRIDWEVSP